MHPKPHEMAIILLYHEYRTAPRLAKALNYKTPRPVQKVLARYSKLIQDMMNDECKNTSTLIMSHGTHGRGTHVEIEGYFA